MIQATSINCSPMKPPAISFGNNEATLKKARTQDIMNAAATVLEQNDITETSLSQFQDITKGFANTPGKRFVETGLAVVVAGAGAKLAGGKLVRALAKNKIVGKNITQPFAVIFMQGMENAGKKLQSIKPTGKNPVKDFTVKYTKEFLDWVQKHGKESTKKEMALIKQEIITFKNKVRESVIEEAKNARKKLTNEEISAEVKKRIQSKPELQEQMADMTTRMQAVIPNKLITETTETAAAIGAGVPTFVAMVKDKDGNGIADYAQDKNKAEAAKKAEEKIQDKIETEDNEYETEED